MAWLENWAKRIKLTIDSTYIDTDLTNFPIMIYLSPGNDIFDELSYDESMFYSETLLECSFSGTSLDTGLWSTYVVPAASVTVSGALELNNFSTDDYSGAHCYTNSFFNKEGIIILTCKWLPHKNHYNTAMIPSITFYDATSTREANYGEIQSKFVKILLGSTADTADRTSIYISGTSTTNSTTGTYYGYIPISIDEILWHDLIIILNCNTREISVDLDGGLFYVLATIPGSVWDTITNYFRLEFSATDYLKDNTERFKDILLRKIPTTSFRKIMITTDDGITPCQMEIEHWDWSLEKAWLWTKVPLVTSGTNTLLYLYYDKLQPENREYVGITGEIPACDVWDDDYELVYHMGNGSDSTYIADSIINNYVGYKPNLYAKPIIDINGKIGPCQSYYDGSQASCTYTLKNFSPNANPYYTIEAIVKRDTNFGNYRLIFGNTNGASSNNFLCCLNNAKMVLYCSSGGWLVSTNDILTNLGEWYYIVWLIKNNIVEYYYGPYLKDSQDSFSTLGTNSLSLRTGYYNSSYAFDGDIDELRFSTIERSAAWIKATYYSNWNALILLGDVEYAPSYFYQGYVKESGNPVSRIVRLYRRDTGELIDSCESSVVDGYYYVTTTHSGEHFIVAFDDDTGEEFNALVLDRLASVGTI